MSSGRNWEITAHIMVSAKPEFGLAHCPSIQYLLRADCPCGCAHEALSHKWSLLERRSSRLPHQSRRRSYTTTPNVGGEVKKIEWVVRSPGPEARELLRTTWRCEQCNNRFVLTTEDQKLALKKAALDVAWVESEILRLEAEAKAFRSDSVRFGETDQLSMAV